MNCGGAEYLDWFQIKLPYGSSDWNKLNDPNREEWGGWGRPEVLFIFPISRLRLPMPMFAMFCVPSPETGWRQHSRWQRRLLSRCYQDVITRLPQPRTAVTSADNDDDNNNSRSDTSFLTIHTTQFDVVSFKSIPTLISYHHPWVGLMFENKPGYSLEH